MPLIVEDGSIVAGADSFVTVAAFVTYAENRSIVVEDDETTEARLRMAADYVGTQEGCFQGSRVSASQSLSWPRKGAYLYGYEVAPNTIPETVKRAQMEYALAAVQGVNLFPNDTSAFIRRERVGPLETEYWGNADSSNSRVSVPAADALIDVLCGNGGMLTLTRV